MAARPPLSHAASENFPRPKDDAEVERMYASVLDHLLTPANVKQQLIDTQPLDKKWQTVKMHKEVFADKNLLRSVVWGDKENALLSSIQRSEIPDMESLTKLKATLTSANIESMTAFLQSGGIRVLVKTIENRLIRKPLKEIDYAIMYEVMSCCKAVMNNSTGMDGFLSEDGAVEVIARSLQFQNRILALSVSVVFFIYYLWKSCGRQTNLYNSTICDVHRSWKFCPCVATTPRPPRSTSPTA